MTEAVIGRLSRIRTLRVEPLTRVRAFGGADQHVLETGRAGLSDEISAQLAAARAAARASAQR
jgi:hypothetical protein